MWNSNKGKPVAELKCPTVALKTPDGKPFTHNGKPLATLSGPCPGAGCGRSLTAPEPGETACPFCGQAVRVASI